jgi:HSP20 family protein
VSRRCERISVSAVALLRQEVDELFKRITTLDRSELLPTSEWCPAVDVYELRDRLVVVIEVPGLQPESLRVSLRAGSLVVRGERRARRAGGEVSFLCLERPHGRFERTIPLDLPHDAVHARASLGRGLLTVTVPRLHERRGQETVLSIEREPAE